MKSESKLDTKFMAKAIELAEKGRGTTSPNPMVGAVIVQHRSIIGQGYHKKAGADHAEIIALKEAGTSASGATLYVSLEPCCHHGKTPPCTDAIIKSGIKRVIAAMIDDNPLVHGKGMSILMDAGIQTKDGVLERRARKLNEAYLKFITTGQPFVTLKMATTLDGRIADDQGSSCWITSHEARNRVHRWRAWSDAVMVGAGTVLADNPRLTVRTGAGADPLRVIVDSTLKAPVDSHVFADGNVLVAATERCDAEKAAILGKRGIEVVHFPPKEGQVPLGDLLRELGARKLTSVLCEGGATLATALIRERLADKAIFAIAPKLLGSGRIVLDDIGIRDIGCALTLGDIEVEILQDDTIISGYPEYAEFRMVNGEL